MFNRIVLLAAVFIGLTACVSQPLDPSFSGTASINRGEAAKTRVSLGLTYLKNGNYKQAKYNLDKALSFAPKSANVHFALAYYYQQVQEQALAENAYQTALDYAPKDPDIINSYAVFLCQQQQYQKAEEFFLQAINTERYIATAETYENMAICRQQQGNLEKAIEYFEAALNHQPTRSKSLIMLARAQYQAERYAPAKKSLWKFERLTQATPESLFLGYQIARAVGDMQDMLNYGKSLNQRFPEHVNTANYNESMRKFKRIEDLDQQTPQSASQVIESTYVDNNEAQFHIVKPQENLYRISLQYDVKMKQLMAWNDIDDPSTIKVGMKLWVKDPNNNE